MKISKFSCSQNTVRLMVTYRNLFYTPIYVAMAENFFSEAGLDVIFKTARNATEAMEALKNGKIDILQTGISRSFMELDNGNTDVPLHISEINRGDGFFLLARKPMTEWDWSNLEGKTLIPIGFTPVPWMSLKYVLKLHRVNMESVSLIRGLDLDEALSQFERGQADFIHLPNPQAQELSHHKKGYIVAIPGDQLGYLCYSSFAVMTKFLENNSDLIQKFVDGFFKAQLWLYSQTSNSISKVVKRFFPEVADAVLEQSLTLYKRNQTWSRDCLIGEVGYKAMNNLLMDGGLVTSSYPYEKIIRPEFAIKAMSAYSI